MTDRESATIWITHYDPPHVSISFTHFPWRNKTRIAQRVSKMAQNHSKGWHCLYCGNLMPEWKRVDAKYCKEGCMKMAARKPRPKSTHQILASFDVPKVAASDCAQPAKSDIEKKKLGGI